MKKSMKERQAYLRRAAGLVCVAEAPEILGRPRRTIYRWEVEGEMPPRVSVTYGTRTYYRRADIAALTAAASDAASQNGHG